MNTPTHTEALTPGRDANGYQWHKLSSIHHGEALTELMAAASIDGIGVIAIWTRDGEEWSVYAMDTESQKLEAVTDFEEECVPNEPPYFPISSRTAQLKGGPSKEEICKTFSSLRDTFDLEPDHICGTLRSLFAADKAAEIAAKDGEILNLVSRLVDSQMSERTLLRERNDALQSSERGNQELAHLTRERDEARRCHMEACKNIETYIEEANTLRQKLEALKVRTCPECEGEGRVEVTPGSYRRCNCKLYEKPAPSPAAGEGEFKRCPGCDDGNGCVEHKSCQGKWDGMS